MLERVRRLTFGLSSPLEKLRVCSETDGIEAEISCSANIEFELEVKMLTLNT